MLRLNRFQYLAPQSAHEAATMLSTYGTRAVLMAGGTDVLVNIKHRLCLPEYVIGTRQLPDLSHMALQPSGWLDIGAGVTLRTIESHDLVLRDYPSLARSAHLVSTPQVRTLATIGGNVCLDVRCNYYNQSHEWREALGFCMKKGSDICRVAPGGDRCWAVSSADTVPVLIALQAEVSLIHAEGARRVPVESLYQDDGLVPMRIRAGEIVTCIHLPPAGTYVAAYRKFRIRQSFDFPLVGMAVALKMRAGEIQDARIVMTAVASLPERARLAEEMLVGRPLEESTIARAGDALYRDVKPMDNTAGTIFHRKRMARVLLERTLREMKERASIQ
ncbi:MAG: xanthine dehydrogenase family protein subunit M [Chloroflexota bacterium]